MVTISSTHNIDPVYSKAANYTLTLLGYSGQAVIELEFLEPEQMRRVNLEHRGKDKPTDVLSFGYLGLAGKTLDQANYPTEYDAQFDGVTLGSILICPEIAKAQAAEYGHSIERENIYLFVHGVLHLLGFDHEDEAERKAMRALEEKIISSI